MLPPVSRADETAVGFPRPRIFLDGFLHVDVVVNGLLLLFTKLRKPFNCPGEMFDLLQVATDVFLVVSELSLELFYLGLDLLDRAVHLANTGHPLEKLALRIIDQPAPVLVMVEGVLKPEEIKTDLRLDERDHLEVPTGDLLLAGQLQDLRVIRSKAIDLPVDTEIPSPMFLVEKDKIDLDPHVFTPPVDQALEGTIFRHFRATEKREEERLSYRTLAGFIGTDDADDSRLRKIQEIQPGELHEILGFDGANDHPSSPSPPSSCRALSCSGSSLRPRAIERRSLAISKPLDRRSS